MRWLRFIGIALSAEPAGFMKVSHESVLLLELPQQIQRAAKDCGKAKGEK
jgi:hypothetical protein